MSYESLRTIEVNTDVYAKNHPTSLFASVWGWGEGRGKPLILAVIGDNS